MKLRSGKILDYSVSALPIKLKKELDMRVTKFKQMFCKNPEHAQELLQTIIDATCSNHRFLVTDKIVEEYTIKHKQINKMFESAGALMLLVIGNSDFYDDNHIQPIYHNDIQAFLSGVTLHE